MSEYNDDISSSIGVERSVWIDAPIDRAWRAVTEPEQLTRWYATNYAWEIPALAVGATVKFHNSETEILLATIEVLDPPHEFTLRWQPDTTYPEMRVVTSFLLVQENGGTRMTLRESGFEAMPEAARQQWIDQISEGYLMTVENLKAHLEGRRLPY